MACGLFGAKPLSEPMLTYSVRNKLSEIFCQGNTFENVIHVMVILVILEYDNFMLVISRYIWDVYHLGFGKCSHKHIDTPIMLYFHQSVRNMF